MNLFLVKNGVQCLLIKWSGCQTDYTEYVKTLHPFCDTGQMMEAGDAGALR